MTEPAAAPPVPSYGVIDHYLGSKGEQYFDWQGRPGILQGRWNRHLWAPHIRRDDDVLDFGCGGGFLLRVLDARARIGVEVNPAAARRARSLGIVTYTTLAEVPGTFDRIITSHVLETVERVCTDVAIITQPGKLVWQGDITVLANNGKIQHGGQEFDALEALFLHLTGERYADLNWL